MEARELEPGRFDAVAGGEQRRCGDAEAGRADRARDRLAGQRLPAARHAVQRRHGVGQHRAQLRVEAEDVGDRREEDDVAAVQQRADVVGQRRDDQLGEAERQRPHCLGPDPGAHAAAQRQHARGLAAGDPVAEQRAGGGRDPRHRRHLAERGELRRGDVDVADVGAGELGRQGRRLADADVEDPHRPAAPRQRLGDEPEFGPLGVEGAQQDDRRLRLRVHRQDREGSAAAGVAPVRPPVPSI